MLEFIQTLLQSYQRVLHANPHDARISKVYAQRIDQLILAEALLRKKQLLQHNPQLPPQIVVIGPTQAGKSSVVNVLLGSPNAVVSPLAGYTVHAQGFCHEIKINQCDGLQQYFGRYQQLTPEQLQRERLDCFALTETQTPTAHLPPAVLWDTPDFDSIGAVGYKEGLIRTLALADVIVLVVSKEKYADQSVWDMMSAIAPLQQPTFICVNKLSEGTEEVIVRSLHDKWCQARSDVFPAVLTLPYHKQASDLVWPAQQRATLFDLVTQGLQQRTQPLQQDFTRYHWQKWLEPVYAEQAVAQQWLALCQHNIKLAQDAYQRDYLNHPQHYATFQTALVELLNLLEIPGMASLLAHTRSALLWPVKKLMQLGRQAAAFPDSSQEVQLLQQIAEHTLIQLADQILEQSAKHELAGWWKELALTLRQQRPTLLGEFQRAAQHYHDGFKQQIAVTAQHLYLKLQELPMVLNSLRATRVSADAAAIALTIKTGGVGVHDLFLAPAMLAITSLLTESALGSYMRRTEIELKQQQLDAVAHLLTSTLLQNLSNLPTQLPAQQFFHISAQQVQAIEASFSEKRHGLRFL